MQTNPVFADVVGQASLKTALSLYLEAFKKTNRLPFLNFTAARGGGKSFLVRKFREGLQRRDGSKQPLLEINGATIKSARAFFEHVYPVWVGHRALLFCDEFHNIPKELQQLFLSIFEVKKEPCRTIEFDGAPYTFNFEEISFCGATTDQQALSVPLRDRLRNISFEHYTPEELYEIFEKNLGYNIEVDPSLRDSIKSVFRGNPRDAVVKAEEILTFASAMGVKKIDPANWNIFCSTMGINPMGLSNAEIEIVKLLGRFGESSLTRLASMTGFDKAAIQRDYEEILLRKNLMEINGKRQLTADGIRLFRKMCPV